MVSNAAVILSLDNGCRLELDHDVQPVVSRPCISGSQGWSVGLSSQTDGGDDVAPSFFEDLAARSGSTAVFGQSSFIQDSTVLQISEPNLFKKNGKR